MSTNVFLSSTLADRTLTEQVARSLEMNGIDAHSAFDLVAGENWTETLRTNLQRSDAVVFVLSDDSLNSGFVMAELGAAVALNKQVVAIRPVGATEPFPFSGLSQVRTLDAGGMSADEIATNIRQQLAD